MTARTRLLPTSWRLLLVSLLALWAWSTPALCATESEAMDVYRLTHQDFIIYKAKAQTMLLDAKTDHAAYFWANLALVTINFEQGNIKAANDTLAALSKTYGSLIQRYALAIEQMHIHQILSDNAAYFTCFYAARNLYQRISQSTIPEGKADMVEFLRIKYNFIVQKYYEDLNLPERSEEYLRKAGSTTYTDYNMRAYLDYLMLKIQAANADSTVQLRRFDTMLTVLSWTRNVHHKFGQTLVMLDLAKWLRTYEATLLTPERRASLEAVMGERTQEAWSDEILMLATALAEDQKCLRHELEAYVTAADWALKEHRPDDALERLDWALNILVRMPAPEWESQVYELLSIVYARLNDKQRSDYYRNLYLDLLEHTRLDHTQEGYVAQVKGEVQEAYDLLVLSLLVAIATVGLCWLVMHRWNRKQKRRMRLMLELQTACNLVTEGKPTPDLSTDKPLSDLQKRIISNVERYALRNAETQMSQVAQVDEISEAIEELDMRIAKEKTDNTELRAKVFLSSNVMPYLDRFIHAFKQAAWEGDRGKLLSYTRELIERIILINAHLTDWIKMKSGGLSLRVETFGLDRLFDIVRKEQGALRRHNIVLDVPQTTLTVKADKTLTLFMINTLVGNARKFTPDGGTISVMAKEEGDMVEISVTDTGCGMSRDTLEALMTKPLVYNGEKHGFGVMNCKGILEKYKKTSSLFARCNLRIESKEGQGSCFAFTLPRGVMTVLLFALSIGFSWANQGRWGNSSHFLQRAEVFMDSAYYSNVYKDFHRTLRMADSVFHYLNLHRAAIEPYRSAPIVAYNASVNPENAIEIQWYVRGELTNYNLILDVRNESAVACLALNDIPRYRYNNAVYIRLYRLMTQDKTTDRRITELTVLRRNYALLTGIIVVVMLIFIGGMYLYYLRRNIIRENQQRNLLLISLSLLENKALRSRLDEVRSYVNELTPLHGIAVDLFDDGGRVVKSYTSDVFPDKSNKDKNIKQAWGTARQIIAPYLYSLPLCLPHDKHKAFGVMSFSTVYSSISPETLGLFTFVADFVAKVIFNEQIQGMNATADLSVWEDKKRIAEFEHYQLYVQNTILENGLSALKHETMYYPSRLQMLLGQMPEKKEQWQEWLQSILLLSEHYHDLYTMLMTRVTDQTAVMPFRWQYVEMEEVIEMVARAMKMQTRRRADLKLKVVSETASSVYTERGLLIYLIDTLVRSIAEHGQADGAVVELHTADEDRFVRLTFILPFVLFEDQDEAVAEYNVFSAEAGHIPLLISKEIIRLHNEKTAHAGYRINMDTREGKTLVWFTLLKKQ